MTPRERVDLSAVDLFASVGRPVASELKAGENIQPNPPSLVFGGTPVILFGEADKSRENQIELSWKGGRLDLPVHFRDNDIGETVWLLQGSRLITDWESRYESTGAFAPLKKRQQSRVAARLLALSQAYGLASREMSLVAVIKRPGDRAGELPQTRVVPVGMPQDTPFEAYFMMQAASAGVLFKINLPIQSKASKKRMAPLRYSAGAALNRANPLAAIEKLLSREASAGPDRPVLTAEEILLDLASHMDSDGGMPGKYRDSRASASVIALLAFLSQGHTLATGAFRTHVARLVKFLQSLTGLSSHRQLIVEAVLEMARNGTAPAGEWITLAQTSGVHWNELESVLNA